MAVCIGTGEVIIMLGKRLCPFKDENLEEGQIMPIAMREVTVLAIVCT